MSGADVLEFLSGAESARFRRENDIVQLRIGDAAHTVGSIAMAFPLSSCHRMIVVRDEQGEEITVLDDIRRLDDSSREIVLEELEKSYFLPRITDVIDVVDERRIVTWRVRTDRGTRTFQVQRSRESVQRRGRTRAVIVDVDGNRYDIPNWTLLSTRAQRLIERYL